jgi:hypothetical protein
MIGSGQGTEGERIFRQAAGAAIAQEQILRRREFRKRPGFGDQAGQGIKLDKEVSIGGENERHMVQVPRPVILSLLQPMFCGQPFAFRFQNG